jgi:hypothetical protein
MIMDTEKLYKILKETTMQLRKGNAMKEDKTEWGRVVHLYFMQHVSEVTDKDVEFVDMHFITVGVNRPQAEKYRDELVALLKTYPNFERFKQGLSYIEVGGEIGDQGAAFQLFALGKVLKLWEVITPEVMGMDGEMADALAGRGFIMFSGYKG